MMLPPYYKNLWKTDLQALKNTDIQHGHGWMYQSDPFLAAKAHELAEAANRKGRQTGSETQSQGDVKHGQALPKPSRWLHAPSVEMGKSARSEVQNLIQRYAKWNRYGLDLLESERVQIMKRLVGLGFKEIHVREATEVCENGQECLEWLLIYVPEDDLPPWSLPPDYKAGISLATTNLKRETILKRLSAGGYGPELCERMLSEHGESEVDAAESLQLALVGDVHTVPSNSKLRGQEEEPCIWQSELPAVKAIYGDKLQDLSSTKLQIQIESGGDSYTLQIQKTKGYPATVPVLQVVDKRLAAYIKLCITRRAILHARECYLGDAMICSIVTWVEETASKIVANPGRLQDLSSVSPLPQLAPSKPASPEHRQPLREKAYASSHSRSAWNRQIRDEWLQRQTLSSQQSMIAERKRLPAWTLMDDIVQAVRSNQVTIVSGETGSGKSTQVIQFVLDDAIQNSVGSSTNIICTQPRRISALSLADRVSEERCSRVGDEVGYSIRGESKKTAGRTRITFMTAGVLLRRLQRSNMREIIDSVSDLSHIVLDEVHERSKDTDFLLILLRDIMKQRKDLKVILMSATMDSKIFQDYFSEERMSIGRVHVPGRTFPIEDYYLDDLLDLVGEHPQLQRLQHEILHETGGVPRSKQDRVSEINYDLVVAAVAEADLQLMQGGSILIFLPGEHEIRKTIEAMRTIPNLYPLMLHGSLPPSEQRRVFLPAPTGKRKVIVSTNIAETSLTIDDVVGVIDTGRVKENTLDPETSITRLVVSWASKAAVQQRSPPLPVHPLGEPRADYLALGGRAGRTRAGIVSAALSSYHSKQSSFWGCQRAEPRLHTIALSLLLLRPAGPCSRIYSDH